MGRIVWLRRFQLREELSESNAVNELLFDITFALSLPPLQALWPSHGQAAADPAAWLASWADFTLLFVSRYMMSFHLAQYSNRCV
jgi:hypothetical protein